MRALFTGSSNSSAAPAAVTTAAGGASSFDDVDRALDFLCALRGYQPAAAGADPPQQQQLGDNLWLLKRATDPHGRPVVFVGIEWRNVSKNHAAAIKLVMEDRGYRHAICVVASTASGSYVTTGARTVMQTLPAGMVIEAFHATELLVAERTQRHRYQAHYCRSVANEPAQRQRKIPIMSSGDIVARLYGFRRNDIVEITQRVQTDVSLPEAAPLRLHRVVR